MHILYVHAAVCMHMYTSVFCYWLHWTWIRTCTMILGWRGVAPRISEIMKFNSTFYDLPQVMVWQHRPTSQYHHTFSVFQS